MIPTLLAAGLALSACATPHVSASAAERPSVAPTPSTPIVASLDVRLVQTAAAVGDALRSNAPSEFASTTRSGSAAAVLAVRCGHLHMADGQVVEGGVLLVEDGVVRGAGDVEVPKGARVVEHNGHVTAGLVAPYSAGYLSRGESNEDTRAFLPNGRAAWGFDPELSRLDDALEAGVTSLLVAPGTSQVVGGRTAVVKTHGGTVVTDNAHLALSMGARAANTDRAPTSYAGIVRALDARFGDDAEGAYAEAKTGNLGLMTYVGQNHEVDRALRLFERNGLKGALVGPSLAGELVERIAGSGCSVVLPNPPLVPNERQSEALTALVESDVPFSFWLDDPLDFRASATTAMRSGASHARALASITSAAADIARVGTSVGKLIRGSDADFVLWSGDPLEFTTSVEAVYIRGELVHTADDHGGDQ